MVGLFCGRVLADFTWLPLPAWLGAGLVAAVGWWWLGRRWPLAHTWPVLFLLVYILYPGINPQRAWGAAAFTLLLLLLTNPPARNFTHSPTRLLAIALFLATLALYFLTLAPDILPADSGEFQYTGTLLGVAHPPGFPLYTLLSWLATKLPFAAAPAYKINLLSAFTSAATLMLVYLTVSRWPLVGEQENGVSHWAGVAAAITLATSTTFWAQATTANIRSLTVLLTALAFYALLRHQSSIANRQPSALDDRWLWLWALAIGLGLTHHLSLLFIVAVMGVYLLWIDRDLFGQPGRWLRPLLFFSLGFLPWIYLIWRGAAGAIGAPDDLLTLRGFFHHALGLGFRGDLFYLDSWLALGQRLQVMGNVLTFQFHPVLLVGMALGFILLVWHNRPLAFLLGGSFLLHTFVTATYRAPQTVEYMLPAYLPLVMMLGFGLSFELRVSSFEFVSRVSRLAPHASRFIMALVFLAAASQLFTHWPSYRWLARSMDTRETVQPWLMQAAPGATILVGWHWYTPLIYLQQVEHLRPDVTVQYVVPGGELYDETWARLIGEALARGRDVIATHYAEIAYSHLPRPDPYGEAYLFRADPLTSLPPGYRAAPLIFGEEIELHGYKLEPAQIELGESIYLTAAWSGVGDLPSGATLFAHLVAEDGTLLAQADVPLRPPIDGLALTQFRLTPRPGAAAGDYAILLGAYQFALDGLQSLPDKNGLARTPLTTISLTAMGHPPYTRNPVYRTVPSGRPLLRLVGYDWDLTLAEPRLYLHWQTEQGYQSEVRDGAAALNPILPPYRAAWGRWREQTVTPPSRPTHYVPLAGGLVWIGHTLPPDLTLMPGQSIWLPQQLVSGRPVLRDYHLSVTLIGFQMESQLWAWRDGDQRDSVPALGAIPTLKWIAGSRVWSPHEVVVDAAAFPGQTVVAALRLYDAFTHQPLPILDERITQQFPWIPLGQRVIHE